MDGAIHFCGLAMIPETRAVARALRRRDPDLLEALISQYEYRLYRYLLYLTSNEDSARDLFQETWLHVLERGHQYDGVSRFEPWLFSIARHLVIDASRRRGMESLDDLLDAGTGQEPCTPEDASPLAEYSNRELTTRLEWMLGRLPAIHREVLLLRFQEDMTIKEISAVLRVPVSTVKSRLYRALNAAREFIEDKQA